MMQLICQLVLSTLLFNIKFTSLHVRGVENVIADGLSHSQVSGERLREWGLDLEPVAVPTMLLPKD